MTCDIRAKRRRSEWEEIEAEFRLWSFHIYYNRAFKTEHDHVARFVKALLASTQPIQDKNLVMKWYREHKDTSNGGEQASDDDVTALSNRGC